MKRINRLLDLLHASFRPVFILYFLTVLALCLQSLLLPGRQMEAGGSLAVYYNNYIIFKQAYFHLISGQDLYILYPTEHWDLFKYSPTFALLFGSLAYFPNALGLTLWNLANAFCLFYAIRILPYLETKIKISILLFVFLEMTTCIQNSQSNALIAGLMILAFALLEKRQYFFATLFIALTVYIKIFGLFAFVLFIFYPDKLKFILYSAFWFVVLTLLPLIVVSPIQLKFLYSSWSNILVGDHTYFSGLSVMGWLESWFHWFIDKNVVVFLGLVIFAIPLIRIKYYAVYTFRLLTLASILIWLVIFNHKAESPTFIIAVAGVALWYFSQPKTPINLILLILVFVFSCLSPTDIFPASVRNNFFDVYAIKAVPCILVWFKVVYDSFALQLKEPGPTI